MTPRALFVLLAICSYASTGRAQDSATASEPGVGEPAPAASDAAAPAAEPAPATETAPAPAAAVSPSQKLQDFDDLSIEGLLNTRVITATKSSAKKVVDSPAIMTVLTHDELLRAGVRDLVDVLQLVPGFQLGVDATNKIYMGFRGLWASEGRVLVLLNGHEMQELLYNSLPLGNRFPVEWIERVEVIRGPGSAIYGGAAELAVVNIVTHDPAEFERVGVYGTYGQMLNTVVHDGAGLGDTYGRRNLSLIAGHVFDNLDELSVGAAAFIGQGQRSDRTYTDVYGSTVSLAGASALDPMMLNVWGGWRGLKLNYLFEDYRVSEGDGYDAIAPVIAHTSFLTHSLDAGYDWQVLPELKVTPRLRYVYQQPWETSDDGAWNPSVQHLQGDLTGSWDPLDFLNLLAGVEYTRDSAHDELSGFIDPNDLTTVLTDISYQNLALFAQGLLDTEWVNVSLGARFEHHSQFGNSFVPRLALTKSVGAFHVKALASQAFHAPTIENLAFNPEVVPETATVYELELGGRLIDELYVGANVFDSTAHKPLVYYYDAVNEGYTNYDKLGSRGLELEARWKWHRHFVNVTYSFYDVAGKNAVTTFEVPADASVLLGFSPHKLTVNSAFEVIENLSVGASMVYLGGPRYAYTSVDLLGDPILEDLGSVTLINAHVVYQNLGMEGLSLGLSLYNLLNREAAYIQPYNNYHAPLPGPPREILLRLAYELPLK